MKHSNKFEKLESNQILSISILLMNVVLAEKFEIQGIFQKLTSH